MPKQQQILLQSPGSAHCNNNRKRSNASQLLLQRLSGCCTLCCPCLPHPPRSRLESYAAATYAAATAGPSSVCKVSLLLLLLLLAPLLPAPLGSCRPMPPLPGGASPELPKKGVGRPLLANTACTALSRASVSSWGRSTMS